MIGYFQSTHHKFGRGRQSDEPHGTTFFEYRDNHEAHSPPRTCLCSACKITAHANAVKERALTQVKYAPSILRKGDSS